MKRKGHLLGLALICCAVAACSSNGNPNLGDGQPASASSTDFAIVYVKRAMPGDQAALSALRNKDDVSLRREYWTRADLYLRDQASPSGTEHNITTRVTGTNFWDVKDVDVSADGAKVIFAMRGPIIMNQKSREPPSWHIWEYVVASDTLRQLTGGSSDLNPKVNDLSPHYLADGRIVFSSTRQVDSKAVLSDEAIAANTAPFEAQTESLNESAFVLHVMDANGTASSIRQISFNQSHDVDTAVLADGRLMWSRWDNAPRRTGGSAIHLYTSNPDGTDVELLYGAQSHNTASTNPSGAASCPAGLACTVQFVHTREMQSGKVLALVRPFTAGDFGGTLQIIDVKGYVENNQPDPDNGAYPSVANGQQPATQNDVRTQSANGVPVPSPGGRFSSAFPLWDGSNRILVGWTECRLADSSGTILPCTDTNLADANSAAPTLTLAPPLYSAWLLNMSDSTLKPIITPAEGVMVTEVVSLQARATPTYLADLSVPSGFGAYGILDIKSVYDRDGQAAGLGNNASLGAIAMSNAANRPARFLRVEKAVSIGDPQLNDGFPKFDRAISLDGSVGYMRQILGYVPIEPDGSVRVKVPANVAFQISVVDRSARALVNFPRHNNWLTLRPGEVLSCNGCHAPQGELNGVSGRSHGRSGLFTALNGGEGTTFTVTAPGIATCPGDTMAEEVAGTSCNTAPYSASTPALLRDVVFKDPWFDGKAASGNGPISYTYSGLTTAIPTALVCQSNWSYFCRSIIDYPKHIHPLWSVVRGDTTVDPRGAQTCTNCHTRTRTQAVQQLVNGQNIIVTVPVVPDGNLELDADPAQSTATQLRAYQQLVDTHAVLTINANNQLVASGATVSGSVSPGSANGSRFFVNGNGVQRFGPGGTHYDSTNSVGWLSSAELRLLSEWVDIGAQYYNNPFDAPLAN